MTQLFSKLYASLLVLARHKHAQRYLALLSFAESSVFPIPPDVMLAPMALSRPDKAWWYAFLTTLASVLGGAFGYLLGYLALPLLMPLLHWLGYEPLYHEVVLWFGRWGFWVIFVAGWGPIPYKLFTLAAGAVHMPLLPFLIASFIGRGSRFFLVSGLMRWGGERLERRLYQIIDRVAWGALGIGVCIFLIRLYFK
jgi:membrane protein YqaA with SNARE-associated domain